MYSQIRWRRWEVVATFVVSLAAGLSSLRMCSIGRLHSHRILKTFAWILALGFALSGIAQEIPSSSALSEALFGEAQEIVHKLLYPDGIEGLRHLVLLARAATVINIPKAEGEHLSLELFRLCSSAEQPSQGIVIQANAVRDLSYFDPVLAMAMLRDITPPHATPNQPLYEDPRYHAAVYIFKNYLNARPYAVHDVINAAQFLGDTGQYPYRAAAAVIKRLSPHSRHLATQIVKDAVTAYTGERGFFNRDEEFLVFLQSLRYLKLRKRLASQVATAFVRKLTFESMTIPGSYYGEVYTSESSDVPVTFIDRNQAFLFLAIPAIRSLYPAFAAQLQLQYPKLAAATDHMKYVSGGFVHQGEDKDENNRHQLFLQQSVLEILKKRALCTTNPAESPFSKKITEPLLDFERRALLIPHIAKRSREEAQQSYNTLLLSLGSFSNPLDRLQAEVALVNAAAGSITSQEYQQLTKIAFNTGLQQLNHYEQSHQSSDLGNGDPLDALKDLVSANPENPELDHLVEALPETWLKADLLLYRAEAHTKVNLVADCSE